MATMMMTAERMSAMPMARRREKRFVEDGDADDDGGDGFEGAEDC